MRADISAKRLFPLDCRDFRLLALSFSSERFLLLIVTSDCRLRSFRGARYAFLSEAGRRIEVTLLGAQAGVGNTLRGSRRDVGPEPA